MKRATGCRLRVTGAVLAFVVGAAFVPAITYAQEPSSVEQLEMNLASLERLDFTPDELAEIDRHATDSDINLWAESSKT